MLWLLCCLHVVPRSSLFMQSWKAQIKCKARSPNKMQLKNLCERLNCDQTILSDLVPFSWVQLVSRAHPICYNVFPCDYVGMRSLSSGHSILWDKLHRLWNRGQIDLFCLILSCIQAVVSPGLGYWLYFAHMRGFLLTALQCNLSSRICPGNEKHVLIAASQDLRTEHAVTQTENARGMQGQKKVHC